MSGNGYCNVYCLRVLPAVGPHREAMSLQWQCRTLVFCLRPLVVLRALPAKTCPGVETSTSGHRNVLFNFWMSSWDKYPLRPGTAHTDVYAVLRLVNPHARRGVPHFRSFLTVCAYRLNSAYRDYVETRPRGSLAI